MSSSLKEYLKKYQDSSEVEKKKKKKKKAVKGTTTTSYGLLVVDEDPVWQKPVNLEDEEDSDSAEEKPQVDEDVEVKRMKRLELLRARKPFGMISEDGSGWVSVAETSKGSQSTDQISDSSPLRRRRSDTPSPERDPKATSADLSPPRKSRHDSPERDPKATSPDLSPPRKSRHDSPERDPKATSPDLSPPRKRRHDSPERDSKDLSPPRKRRHDSPSLERGRRSSRDADEDLSPPRQRHQSSRKLSSNADMSPPRKRRHDSPERDSKDLSPPRKRRHDSPPLERGRRSSRDADEDLSPPRQRHQSSRKLSSNADMSPPRRVRQEDSRSSSMADLSPPRKGRSTKSGFSDLPDKQAGPDLSPPRKKNKETTPSQRVKTGLVTGKEVKEEVAKIQKAEIQRFKEMDASISGRGAEAVYRDKKTGQVMSKEDYLNSKKKEKPKEIKLEWGKGLAQKREAEAKLQEMESEKEKPFARTRDDPELDKMLKERVRFGDPMAHLVKKKQWDEPVLENLGNNDKMKESGFIIPQDVPKHSWRLRNIHPPENRYGIKPGRHWDGVDRSNGFEKQMFQRSNEKQATEREAYLWSVADM